MTETAAATPDPDSAPTEGTPPHRSGWSGLNRTNRIATLALGALASVFVAAVIFGAGVLVGSELNDDEGYHEHHGSESFDGQDDHVSGDDEDLPRSDDSFNDDRGGEPTREPSTNAPGPSSPARPTP